MSKEPLSIRVSLLNAKSSLIQAQANAQQAVEIGALAAPIAMAQRQQLLLQDKLATLAAAHGNACVAEAVNTLKANTSLVNSIATNINAQVALAKAEKR